jgi:hypothetical protein
LSDQSPPDLPLPSGWAKNVKSAVLHVISVAQFALTYTRGWAANSINARVLSTRIIRSRPCHKDLASQGFFC